MTVQYSSSRRDIASWYWYSLRHNRKHLAALVFSLLVIGVVTFLSERQSGTVSTLRAIGISFVWIVALALFFALYPQLRFKPQRRTLTIAPEAISTTIGTHSKTYRWSDVASVMERGDHVYVGFKNLNAFVVPPRAFSSAEARRDFIRLCREWRQASADRPAA